MKMTRWYSSWIWDPRGELDVDLRGIPQILVDLGAQTIV